jgi:perosamine synthetase
MIPIYKPYIEPYKASALKAIEDEWISNYGIYVDLAATTLKEFLGVKYCILLNNGTSATHCLFRAIKYKHPEIRKVYIPNYVFIAPWNCGLQEYPDTAFEVMKTDPLTMNIDTSAEYINSLEVGSAVVIVHNLGNIVNVPRLKRLRPDLIFVEDNCEGLFGTYEGVYSGTSPVSLCSAVSFYGNKTITTGEGGAFFTNDIDLYKYMKTYYSHGMSNVRYIHSMQGTNYRMTNIQAGFLYDQLNDIKTILAMKSRVYTTYAELCEPLMKSDKIRLLEAEDNTAHSKWMFTVFIKGIKYEAIEHYMLEKNVQIRPIFYDIHAHDHLKTLQKCDGASLPEGEVQYTGCMLPSYPELTLDQQKYIMQCIEEYLILRGDIARRVV